MRNALFLALALLLVPVGDAVAQAKPAVAVTEKDRREFRSITEADGGTLGVIRRIYPEDYLVFETRVLSGVLNGTMSEDEVARETFTFARGIAERNTRDVRRATDDQLYKLYQAQYRTSQELKVVSPQACVQFSEDGMLQFDLLMSMPDSATTILDRYTAVQFATGKAGRKAKVERKPLTSAELDAIIGKYIDLGGDANWLTSLGTPKADLIPPVKRCEAGLVLMQAILAQPKATVAKFYLAQ